MSRGTPEGTLKKQVKAYLDEIGAHYFMPVQFGYGKRAVDFLCCVKGRFVAIETKIRPREPTELQTKFLQATREAGGIGFVAYDIEDVWIGLEP